MGWLRDKLKRWIFLIFTYVPILGMLVFIAVFVRVLRKTGLLKPKFDVGLGPEPLINNVYHKRALERFGWKAETFVSHQYFITQEFDYSTAKSGWPMRLASYWLFLRAIFRYRILYLYFNGGPLAWTDHFRIEAFLLRVAGVKTFVMPYGSDIHDLSRSRNLRFKAAMMESYPDFQRLRRDRVRWQIDYWSKNADHILSGCDWVDFMWRWDTLVPAHFSIDTEKLSYRPLPAGTVLRVLHAPNHRAIKGTQRIISAIEKLRSEGLAIELVLVERLANAQLLDKIAECHVVIDQLIIGWHGIFALEAIALGRPTICYLREDLLELFATAGDIRIEREKVPFISSDGSDLEQVLRNLIQDRGRLERLSKLGREYVETNHSLDAIGRIFDQANRKLQ